jgi:hypothetical protein
MRRSELADRPEHVTAQRGEVIELDGPEAERLLAAGGIVEGEVDPAAHEAEQAAAAAEGDTGDRSGTTMPEPVTDPDAPDADAVAAEEGSESSSGRRRR